MARKGKKKGRELKTRRRKGKAGTVGDDDDPSCHGGGQEDIGGLPKIVLVGNPNVGKSVIFNHLTGSYVVVSNYPGTTVAVDRGSAKIDGRKVGVIDTPGMYSLIPITEEERVARNILFEEGPGMVINIADAKNLERMLHLTLQLIEAGKPVVLVLNIMDEARAEGLRFDLAALEQGLGVPVIAATATKGEGMKALKKMIAKTLDKGLEPGMWVRYGSDIEKAVARIEKSLVGTYPINKRAMGLMLLQEDKGMIQLMKEKDPKNVKKVLKIIRQVDDAYAKPLDYVMTMMRQKQINKLVRSSVRAEGDKPIDMKERVSRAMIRPLTGIPILFLVIMALYILVGVLAAGKLVDLIETGLFEAYINPAVDGFLESVIPWEWLRGLFGGEFGIITLGLRYAVAIILPIVGIFFLAFSILEDSGYLPRLSLLIDRVFKKIGLSGRAIIPMTLGLGCDTMATLVTRTLESKKERMVATLLLALAIPCSAQLGVIFGILSTSPLALLTWTIVVIAVMLFIGWLSSKLLPGGRPQFFMEIPPLRRPKLSNVLIKTYTRMVWYFKEIVPIFVLASILLWAGNITGIFDFLVSALVPVVSALGLPALAAPIFLYGFFRRDYGAAGLYDISGDLTVTQLTVAAVTLTLFIPCIAQVVLMWKERGKKFTLAVVAFIFPFAFLVGFLLNIGLTWLGGLL